jgi:hypothetical protein
MATLNAVFHRLSQPSEPIRWSQVALITSDKFTEHSFKKLHPDEEPPKYIQSSLFSPSFLFHLSTFF